MKLDITDWVGLPVLDRDGSKIGSMEAVYFDTSTDEPVFTTVKVGLIGSSLVFVPLADAVVSPKHVRVAVEGSTCSGTTGRSPGKSASPDQRHWQELCAFQERTDRSCVRVRLRTYWGRMIARPVVESQWDAVKKFWAVVRAGPLNREVSR